ncbi:Serine/threonine-protein phosphatase 2A activator 1 [Echria macrotheca]|uniref:Serine/threonine-protein phosphatase 2A activator n=1 Tax=Echria macrotheca TaxID=438768 RepID=A0AAJ0BKP2_9PEZI|nr:Serine/threonine-protein phosphatase 2A activator 1 [Echria macrotheca]
MSGHYRGCGPELDFPPASPPSTASSSATPSFQKLEILRASTRQNHTFIRPTKRIHEGPDVSRFLVSQAYRDIGIFVLQLNRAMLPRRVSSQTQMFPLDAPRSDPQPVLALRDLLKKVEALIDEAPLDPGPRRFGNVGFRTWHQILEERADSLLKEFLPGMAAESGSNEAVGALDEVKAYFLGSFGSAQRLDYGTGHELSFLAFLGCLWKLGFFVSPPSPDSENKEDKIPGELERSIVLGAIEPYLQVIRRLILHYTLEPAGSHGVWGLDDHSFVPYILGSAQLARPIWSESEPTPLEGSAPQSPRPSDVAKPERATAHRDRWMYFSAVAFINDVKKGPFWEHSPILFDVSGIRDGWGKINKGMLKMFNAEVLAKYPVVQHFPFGSLFSWEADPDAQKVVGTSVHLASQPTTTTSSVASGEGGPTASPWTQATRMPGAGAVPGPGIPYSRAPWAGTGSTVPMPRGGVPDTGPLPVMDSFPPGVRGTASAQHSITKAPWAK